MKILEGIKEVKEKSKKRNFSQRYDLIINLKDLDLKKAENKIDEFFVLPKGSGKESSVTLFSDTTKKIEGCKILKSSEIEELGRKKKEVKKVINQTDFFLAEPKLMPVVGKHLGKFLAPVGKMPKPLVGDVEKMIKDSGNGVRVKVTKQAIIHTVVGSEKMDDKDVEENIRALLNFLKSRLPRGKNNIKDVYFKLTMGQPIKLEVD
jgi:large subunit ribosomal protein L1